MAKPLVSISCITFNHGPYIKECLDSFLMQKTSFEFEILIHDDASTDDTVNIIKLYQEKYPDLIKAFFQKDNQYSKGQRGINIKYNFPRARGKYIALCEGDDFWIDPFKLQKQVDFLDNNTNYIACFTNANICNDRVIEKKYIQDVVKINYDINDVIEYGGGFYPTASLVFRNIIKSWPKFTFKYRSGDRILSLLLATKGDFYFLDEITCVYRQHSGGVFNSIKDKAQIRQKINYENINLLNEFDEFSKYKYHNKIKTTKSKLAKLGLLKNSKIRFNEQTIKAFRELTLKDWLSFSKTYFFRK